MSRYTLEVDLGDRSYPIHIGEGLLSQADLFKPHVAGKVAMICTNTTVGPLYADRLKTSLLDAGAKSVFIVSLPDGEEYKDWPNLQLVFDALLQNHCDRKTVLVALGGGVVLNDAPDVSVAAHAVERLDEHRISITIGEGKYHQVKRMVAAAGNRVEALHRVAVGRLELPADLAPGEWRWFDPAEV